MPGGVLLGAFGFVQGRAKQRPGVLQFGIKDGIRGLVPPYSERFPFLERHDAADDFRDDAVQQRQTSA